MGRGPFFGGSRKMRGFPMNLSPGGLDDGSGFPYFGGDNKFDFGYGPAFHPHDAPFFPGHPGPGMPFNAPGILFCKINIFQYFYFVVVLLIQSICSKMSVYKLAKCHRIFS